ncbi:MAG: cheW-like domain protein [Moraxellaceae bacterium]|nr:cheW-like domain protein [Moraxellaceae bacterium]
MLYLLLQLGGDRYALDAGSVVEVLPLVELRHLPQAPPGIAGIFSYHGTPVPVLDLCLLALGRPVRRRFSTRIVLVALPDSDRLLGLMAEQVTQTLRRASEDFRIGGGTGAGWLGPVTSDAAGLIQRIEAGRLLPPAAREVLFA